MIIFSCALHRILQIVTRCSFLDYIFHTWANVHICSQDYFKRVRIFLIWQHSPLAPVENSIIIIMIMWGSLVSWFMSGKLKNVNLEKPYRSYCSQSVVPVSLPWWGWKMIWVLARLCSTLLFVDASSSLITDNKAINSADFHLFSSLMVSHFKSTQRTGVVHAEQLLFL